MIPDTRATPSPVEPASGSGSIDLSPSILQCMEPDRVAALREIGVAALMTVPIVRQNKPVGLFVCHHPTPHHVSAARRVAVELFSQMFSLMLESRMSRTHRRCRKDDSNW